MAQREEERRKAEEDKQAAIYIALENRSREYMKEMEEKKRLEERIKVLNSQVHIGGQKVEEMPEFIKALEEKQRAIRKEYESRLTDLEKERQ